MGFNIPVWAAIFFGGPIITLLFTPLLVNNKYGTYITASAIVFFIALSIILGFIVEGMTNYNQYQVEGMANLNQYKNDKKNKLRNY